MINRISVLGSTGSIGTQTLDVLKEHKTFLVPDGFSIGSNIQLLARQIEEFSPTTVSVNDPQKAKALKNILKNRKIEILHGEEGNIAVATLPSVDRVVLATPGLPGIKPAIGAIQKKKTLALATKEVLVSAGSVVTKEARENNVKILPVDSEHSAIFQCLQDRSIETVSKIFLTCSGGPFRGMGEKDLKKVTLKDALSHPSWKMGKKITVDSATLMNKGFEAIEAHWLFGVPLSKIKVIIHPQSVVHSAVEFIDGTIIAQIGPADMRLPIQYALFYPEERKPNKFKRFSFDDYPNVYFEHPDKKTFRCLDLAYQIGKQGGSLPAVLNAANDTVVEAFLEERLEFYKIPEIIEKTLLRHVNISSPSLDEIFEVDKWAKNFASILIAKN